MPSKPCPAGCTCGRHRKQPGGSRTPCLPGCTCNKHTNSGYGGGRKPTLFVAVGQRFGRGVVTDPEVRTASGARAVRAALLRCDCGTEYVAALKSLFGTNARGRPRVRSCGCLLREVVTVGTNRTHGLTHHPLYHTWRMMLWRCENPDADDYFRYGGRGIKVCERWHDVRLFVRDIETEIGPKPPADSNYTLDRTGNDGDYEPGNVRWASRSQQALNSRPRGTC